jgi:hypothetical protein
MLVALAAGCDDGTDDPTDPLPIEVRIGSPAADAVLQGGASIVLELTGPVASVRLTAGDVEVAAADVTNPAAGSIAVPWDTTTATDGPVTLVAHATGADAQADESDPVTVVIDNTAPLAAFGIPRFALLAGEADVALDVVEANVASIRVTDGATVLFASTEAAASFVWDVSALEDRLHRLALEVTDIAGRTARVADFPVIVANHGEEVAVTYDPSARVSVPVDWATAEYHTRGSATARPEIVRLVSWAAWEAAAGWRMEYTIGQGLCPHRGIAYRSVTEASGEAVIELGRDELASSITSLWPAEYRSEPVFPYNADPLTFGAFFGHLNPLDPETHVGTWLPIEIHYVYLYQPS